MQPWHLQFLPGHQVIRTLYKMSQMATCFVLIAEKSTGGVFANKESAEASENMKLMVKLPSLLSSAIL